MKIIISKIQHLPSYIWVIAACITGALIRILPAWASIFADGHVNFSAGPDSYYQMCLVRQIFDGTLPISINTIYPSLIYGLSWILSFGHPSISFIEHVAIFIPVVFTVITIIFAYFIGKKLHSALAGHIAAFVIAVIPGEYLGRSMLGSIDYHAAEVFFTTGAILFFIIAYQMIKLHWRLIAFLTGAVFVTVYYFIWPGAIGFLIILFGFNLYIIYNIFINNGSKKIIFINLIIICFGLITYYASTKISAISGLTIATTSETAPALFYPNVFLHVILAFILCYIYIRLKGKMYHIISCWTAYLIIATIWQVRFDYYLIIPLAYLVGFSLSSLRQNIMTWEKDIRIKPIIPEEGKVK